MKNFFFQSSVSRKKKTLKEKTYQIGAKNIISPTNAQKPIYNYVTCGNFGWKMVILDEKVNGRANLRRFKSIGERM